MPLQQGISSPALRRVDTLTAQGHPGAQKLATSFIGQGVGLMNQTRPVKDVVYKMVEDFLAAADRLRSTLED